MSEGPAQQPPQDPRPDAADGERAVLEGRVIPSRSQAQRQYDAHPPRHAAPDDPRQQFAAPTGPGSAAAHAPASGPAWDPQPPQAGQVPAPEQIPGQIAEQGQIQQAPVQQGPVQQAPVQQAAPPYPYAEQPPVQQAPQGQAYAQQPPQAPVPPQQGHVATPQGYAPQQAFQAPQSPQHALGGNTGAPAVTPQAAPQIPQSPTPPAHQAQNPLAPPVQEQSRPQTRSFGAKAAAFQERVQRIREAAAAEAAATASADAAAETSRPGGAVPPPGGPATPSFRASSATPPPAPGAPDWDALAEQQAASGARHRRVMMLAGGGVAVALIAGVVATAVVLSGSSSGDTDIAGPSSSSGTSQQPLPPEPSFSSVAPPPPANPLDYLGTAAKDTAPLTPDTLLPGAQFLMDGRVYVKTASTSTTQCATGARSTLATALSANGCTQLIRATYTNGTMAVTVGVAVFADTAHALKLQKTAQYLAPLNGGGVTDFCHAVACQMTSNAVGRYAYFAISGLKDGQTLSATDKLGAQSANDASNFAFQEIIQRGRDAAAADPTRN